MLGQRILGMEPRCFELPAGELPRCDCVDADGMGQSVFDGMSYYRLSEPNRFRRLLIRTTAYLRTRGVPGSWRFEATFRGRPNPLLHLERWVRQSAATTLVHAHTPYDCAAWGAHVARALQIPWVYEIRGFWDLTEESAGRSRVNGIPADQWRRREIELTCQADALITLSESMRRELMQRGLPSEHIHIVRNGATAPCFGPPPARIRSCMANWIWSIISWSDTSPTFDRWRALRQCSRRSASSKSAAQGCIRASGGTANARPNCENGRAAWAWTNPCVSSDESPTLRSASNVPCSMPLSFLAPMIPCADSSLR